ncbi:MAG: response regulator transcription factor [Bacteroidetes bacterium]|nr:response regulator transcription factor [Bacteroidota bacterium]
MKAIIIDDEESGRKTVRNFIEKYTPDVEVVDEADNVKNGLFSILSNKPDVVFLDVRMPDGTGFDLLEKLPKINFKIIFVTAYEQHAIKAFKYSAIDYLLKPVNPDDFIEAINKLKSGNRIEEIGQKVDILLKNKIRFNRIALPTSSGLKMISVSEIIRCESDNNYTNFFLISGKKILVSKTLKDFDELLSSEGFYRVHKSHLINIQFVKEYIRGEGGTVVLEDNTPIEVSRRKKDGLIELLSN